MPTEILELYRNPQEAFDPLANHPNPEKLVLDSLNQGTLLAGREKPFVWELDEFTSEGALHRYRAQIEIEALINLAERGPIEIPLDKDQKEALRTLYTKEVFDPAVVAQIDHFGYKGKKKQEHDVTAVETSLGYLLEENDLGHLKSYLHLGMTSEDTNNLAFNFMLRDVTNKVLIPSVTRVADRLAHLAVKFEDTPTNGITHAQKASPTTFGKQFGYLLDGMSKALGKLDGMRLSGKFSGAVGNHSTETVLFPDFDYDDYAEEFVESLGFTYEPIQNQRNDHHAVTDLLSVVSKLAVVGKNTTDNVWLKLLANEFVQEQRDDEHGSSIMTHKINPWRIEAAEAAFEQAISLINGADEGLIASRHERDLSDHPWQRAYGDMIGRVVLGFNYFTLQLDRLIVNADTSKKVLSESAVVLSELIQTAGRAEGDPDAYDKVRVLTQGKEFDLEGIREVADKVLPKGILKDRVMEVTPETYTGIADEEARAAVIGWHASKLILKRGVLDESTSIDAVLFDFDGTLHFGDKDELFARLSAISQNLGSGFNEEELLFFGDRSDFIEMRKLMIEEHNRSFPDSQINEEEFQTANDAVSGSFDHHFRTADEAHLIIEAIRKSGKKTGLVTTRGNRSRDRLLTLHGFDGIFDVIVGRDDCDRRKPHPQPIALALEELGINDPTRSLYVGDLQIDDVGAGNALRMKTALISDQPLDRHGPIPSYKWPDLKPLARLYSR